MSQDSRAGALVAALPPLIFAVGLSSLWLIAVPLDMIVVGGPTRLVEAYNISGRFEYGLIVAAAAILVLTVGGLVAALRRLPVWGYTWVGAAAAALLTVLNALADEKEFLLALLIGPLALLLTVLIAAFFRGSWTVCIAVLVAVGLVNMAVFWMGNQVWQPWLTSQGRPVPWPLLAVLMSTLLVGPVLSLFGPPLRRILGRVQA